MPSYSELQRLHVADAMVQLPGQVERLGWSTERLAAHRRHALRLIVGTAQIRSPWHRSRLRGRNSSRNSRRSASEMPR